MGGEGEESKTPPEKIFTKKPRNLIKNPRKRHKICTKIPEKKIIKNKNAFLRKKHVFEAKKNEKKSENVKCILGGHL